MSFLPNLFTRANSLGQASQSKSRPSVRKAWDEIDDSSDDEDEIRVGQQHTIDVLKKDRITDSRRRKNISSAYGMSLYCLVPFAWIILIFSFLNMLQVLAHLFRILKHQCLHFKAKSCSNLFNQINGKQNPIFLMKTTAKYS